MRCCPNPSVLRRAAPLLLLLPVLVACSDSTGPEESIATLELSAPRDYLAAGSTLQLTTTAKDASGKVLRGLDITWSSSDPSVAAVSQTGLVEGIAPGEATVTAAAGGEEASVTLAVRESGPLPEELSGTIRRVAVEIEAGAEHRVTDDLTVFADEQIRIDGKLLAESGADVTLFADSALVITGVVGDTSVPPAPDTTDAGNSSLTTRLPVAAEGHGPPSETDVVVGSGSVRIDGARGEAAISAGNVYIAGLETGADKRRLRLRNSVLRADHGANGSPGKPGADGGDVVIGGSAVEKAVDHGHSAAAEFHTVVIEGDVVIFSGWGGSGHHLMGLDDAVVTGRTVDATGTTGGGDGGNVGIGAIEEIHLQEPGIHTGYGGRGGMVGPESGMKAPDGLSAGERGYDLDARTGDGGDGGDLTINAPTVLGGLHSSSRIGGGGGRGTFHGGAGDGGPGGDGGDATILLGSEGTRGAGPSGVAAFSPRANTVRIFFGGNGGDANTQGSSGGQGGSVALLAAGDESLELSDPHDVVLLQDVGNGGHGFDGCSVSPPTNGTDGGNGGDLDTTVDGSDIYEPDDSRNFYGGDGGDGEPFGEGGAGGTAREGQLPGDRSGEDGFFCPEEPELSVSPDFLEFSHTIDETGCPQAVGTVELTFEGGDEARQWSISGGEHLEFSPSSGTIEPGETVRIDVLYDCSSSTSFQSTATFEVSDGDGGTLQAELTVDGTLFKKAVRLDHTLSDDYQAGDEITLDRIEGGRVVGPEEGICESDHLHDEGDEGIYIDGDGPFADPAPNGCGYGEIVLVQV